MIHKGVDFPWADSNPARWAAVSSRSGDPDSWWSDHSLSATTINNRPAATTTTTTTATTADHTASNTKLVLLCVSWPMSLLGLCKWYNTHHDTHEAIFDMYQRYICLASNQTILIYPQISQEFGNFNDQNIINLSKNLKYIITKMNDTICII